MQWKPFSSKQRPNGDGYGYTLGNWYYAVVNVPQWLELNTMVRLQQRTLPVDYADRRSTGLLLQDLTTIPNPSHNCRSLSNAKRAIARSNVK